MLSTLYIKPSFLPLIPVDVRAYGAVHTAFPHESTLDQWFSESQFESYRMLGRHQMGDLLERNAANDHPDPRSRLGGLFEAAQLLVTREKQASSCMACDSIKTLGSAIGNALSQSRSNAASQMVDTSGIGVEAVSP